MSSLRAAAGLQNLATGSRRTYIELTYTLTVCEFSLVNMEFAMLETEPS